MDDEHNPHETVAQVSCQNCRARKVKCDRRSPGCVRCAKLEIPCSYDRARYGETRPTTSSKRVGDSEPEVLTEAGMRRRRIQRACDACRLHKSKCSGTRPCRRCDVMKLSCLYRAATPRSLSSSNAGRRNSARQREESRSRISDACEPHETTQSQCHGDEEENTAFGDAGTTLSPAITQLNGGVDASGSTRLSPSAADCLLGDKTVVRQCIDAYFMHADASDCIFLHRASFLSSWLRQELNPTLVKMVCALGLRLNPGHHDSATPRAWAKEVQQSLLAAEAFNDCSASSLQALVLLIRFHFTSDFTQDAWILLAVAARIAFTMRLNYERLEPASTATTTTTAATSTSTSTSTFGVIHQECRRRLMWAIFVLDKLFSGGIEDLTVCPSHRLQIRLPCDAVAFQRGIVPPTEFLHGHVSSGRPHHIATTASGMDATSYRVRLFDLRDRIHRYTRRVILQGSAPADSQGELQALDDELHRFRDGLPPELRLDPERLVLMAHSDELTPYMVLHAMWHLCRSDLHRFLIPGIREAVAAEVMAHTPQPYIDHCQQVCFDAATSICDLLSAVHELQTSKRIANASLAVSLYQCVQILHHLGFRIPAAGPHCLGELKRKLSQGVALTSHLGTTYVWLRPCFQDIEKLISVLGQRPRYSPGLADRNLRHGRSKHVFAPPETQGEDGGEEPERRQHRPEPSGAAAFQEGGGELRQAETPLSLDQRPADHVLAVDDDGRWNQLMMMTPASLSRLSPLAPGNAGIPAPPRPRTRAIPAHLNLLGSTSFMVDAVFPLDPLELVLSSYADADPLAWPTLSV